MGAMDGLFQMVKDSILKHTDDQKHTGFDPSNLLNHIGELFGNQNQGAAAGNVPRGTKPASQDPYGDPADQMQSQLPKNIKPASQDPYGDPADQENQRSR